MNLADELRGIVPRKTLKGRVVNNDDPPIVPVWEQRRGSGTMGKVMEFVYQASDRFTAFDVAEAIGTYKNVASYLHKLKDRGEVRLVGKIASKRDKHGRIALWERV